MENIMKLNYYVLIIIWLCCIVFGKDKDENWNNLLIAKDHIHKLHIKYRKENKWNSIIQKIPIPLRGRALDPLDIIIYENQPVGTGLNGMVHNGTLKGFINETETPIYMVIKRLLPNRLNSEFHIRSLLSEAKLMRMFRDTGRFMPIYGISYKDTSKDLMLIMPYMKYGTVKQAYVEMIENNEISINYTFLWIKQLFDGIAYMHENGYTHRDLHEGNLFLDDHLNLIIGDLGLSIHKTDTENINNDINQIIKIFQRRKFVTCMDKKIQKNVENIIVPCFDKNGQGKCSARNIYNRLKKIKSKKI